MILEVNESEKSANIVVVNDYTESSCGEEIRVASPHVQHQFDHLEMVFSQQDSEADNLVFLNRSLAITPISKRQKKQDDKNPKYAEIHPRSSVIS